MCGFGHSPSEWLFENGGRFEVFAEHDPTNMRMVNVTL
jgi:hypothetical protein